MIPIMTQGANGTIEFLAVKLKPIEFIIVFCMYLP